MKQHYIVYTHVGKFETWATSSTKAISNIRYRLYGRCADSSITIYWTAKAA